MGRHGGPDDALIRSGPRVDSHQYDYDRDDFAALGIIGAPSQNPDFDRHEEAEVEVFVVTNPPGSVSVSAMLDGSVYHVQLRDSASRMSEAGLAEEIRVIADLARQKAQSAQYNFIAEKLAEADTDADADARGSAMLREFMSTALRLPSPQEAAATREEVFTTRYGVDYRSRYGGDDGYPQGEDC